jgi:hypothetical protein
VLILLLAGCGSSSPAEQKGSSDATATPTPAATPEPVVAAEHFLGCADVQSSAGGLAFVVSGPIHNVGDVPLRVRATILWPLRGGRDLRANRTYRLRAGQRRRVRFTVPVTADIVRRFHTSCEAGLKILGRKGTVTTAP